MGIARAFVPPTHLTAIPVETDVPGRPGVRRQLLSQEPITGAKTRILEMPPGYRSELSREHDGEMEFHSSDEEIFVLKGVMQFGRWYDLPAFGYANHPAGWFHPADQQSEYGWTMLIKSGAGTVDFGFIEPPDGWDGSEGFVESNDGPAPKTPGVSRLFVDGLPWQEVVDASGSPIGMRAKTLWRDAETDWATWVMHVPAGWQGSGSSLEVAGGDEMFVLDGDLLIDRGDGLTRLTAGSYYSDPQRFVYGGSKERSEKGCLAIRWSQGNDLIYKLPSPFVGT